MDLQLKACIVCAGGDKVPVSFVVSGAISINEHKSEKHFFSSLVVYKLDWSVSHIWVVEVTPKNRRAWAMKACLQMMNLYLCHSGR